MKPNCDRHSKKGTENLPEAPEILWGGWLRSRRARKISEYVVSILVVVVATVLRLGLDPVLGEHHPFTLYFGAVAIASWYGGFGPGMLALVLSYLGADWFFIAPRFEINWPKSNLDEFLALMAFVFSSFAIVFTTKIMREALLRARRKQQELEQEITERERAQEALRDAQAKLRQYAGVLEERVQERTADLQETIRSLEGVCYHIAHDLRAPLRAMEGFSNILSEEHSSVLDPTSRRYLENIQQAANRMELLINGLLEYGRLGHEQFPLGPVCAEEILEKVLCALATEMTAAKARLSIPDSWPEIIGNEDLLFTVFHNLLSNALKFVEPGESPVIKIWTEPGADALGFVRFWMEDSGIGIPVQRRHKAFLIFERLLPGRQYPGTGMGLALASKAVECMNGRIGVEAAPVKGSRFWFEVPAVSKQPSQQKSRRSTTEALALS